MWPLLLTGLGLCALGWRSARRPDQRRTALAVLAVTGLVFQVVHVLEHTLQAGVSAVRGAGWEPWLTPWAQASREALGTWSSTDRWVGGELLHLLGNVVFLAGLVALGLWARREPVARRRDVRLLFVATLAVQSFHVAEHVLLTSTILAMGCPHGLSTLFGLVPIPARATVRIWFHFLLNAIPTAMTVLLLLRWRTPRTGRLEADDPAGDTARHVTHA